MDGINNKLKKLPLVTSSLRRELREWQENEGFPFRWVAFFSLEGACFGFVCVYVRPLSQPLPGLHGEIRPYPLLRYVYVFMCVCSSH